MKGNYSIYASAFLLVSGVGFGVAGFTVPPVGSVSESVLLLIAQCFIMAGSFAGIDAMVLKTIKKFVRNEQRENRKDTFGA